MLLDSTLREGEQTPGVSFSIEQKLEIARLLDEAGVDMIEAGHPSVAPDVAEAVRRIAREGLRAEVLAHSRASKRDIDEAAACEPDRIAIFYGVSDVHLRYKHRVSREEALNIIAEHVEYARSYGLKVRFTAEDATRADYNFLVEVCKTAYEAGADRVSIADTVGAMTPFRMRDLISRLRRDLPSGLEIDVHCHNDLGLATANALAGFEGGATCIHVTVNGLGERAGIPPLQEVAVALKVLYGIDTVKLELLPKLSNLVERYSGIPVPPNAPIVGDNAFTHKAGVHVAGVLANPETYELFPPELVGRTRSYTIDKYTGRKAVKARLEQLGVILPDDVLERVVLEIKRNPEKKFFADDDLLELVEAITGEKLVPRPPSMIEALVAVKCAPNTYTTSVARRISMLPGVIEVAEVSGDFDIEVRIRARDTAELNQVIESVRSIRGVESTYTRIILKKLEKR